MNETKAKMQQYLSYFALIQIEENLDINRVSNENYVYDSGQLPYSRDKTRRKVLNRLQSKFIPCKVDNLQTHAEVPLYLPTQEKSS